jgi:hypothetical protein
MRERLGRNGCGVQIGPRSVRKSLIINDSTLNKMAILFSVSGRHQTSAKELERGSRRIKSACGPLNQAASRLISEALLLIIALSFLSRIQTFTNRQKAK